MPFTTHLIVGLFALSASSINAQKICDWEVYDGKDLSIPASNLEDYIDPEYYGLNGKDCLLKCCDDPDCHALYQSDAGYRRRYCKIIKELPSSFVSMSTGQELSGQLWTANYSNEKVPFSQGEQWASKADIVVFVKKGLAAQGTDYCYLQMPTIEVCMPSMCSRPHQFIDYHKTSLFVGGDKECKVSADCDKYTWSEGCDCQNSVFNLCYVFWKLFGMCTLGGAPAEWLPNSQFPSLACRFGFCAAYTCDNHEMSEMSVTPKNSFSLFTIWTLVGLGVVVSFLMWIVRLRSAAPKSEPLLKAWQ